MYSTSVTQVRSKKAFFKYLSLVLSFVILFGISPSKVFATSTIVSEDFNSCSLGEFPLVTDGASVWKYTSAGAKPTVKIVQDTVAGITYANIKNTSSSSSYFGRNFNTAEKSGLIYELDVNAPTNLGGSILMYDSLSALNTKNVSLRLIFNSGKITIYSGSQAKDLGAYNTKKWYHIKSVLNIHSKTYKISIVEADTGKKIYQSTSYESFYGSPSQVGGLSFQPEKSGGTLNVDNIRVSFVDVSLSNLQLNGATLESVFTPEKNSYNAIAQNSTSNVIIAPTANDSSNVNINVNGANILSGNSIPFAIVDGDNKATVTVSSSVYSDVYSSYTININRIEASPNPRNVKITPQDGKVFITWVQPNDTGYKSTNIYISNTDIAASTLAKTVSSGVYEATIDGLTNGTNYTFTVKGYFADSTESAGIVVNATPMQYIHQMEALDRGLVAMKKDNSVFLSWRLFGNDPADIGFNIYRDGIKLNSTPITTSTNFLDDTGTISSTYTVAPIVNGVEGGQTLSVKVIDKNYLSIPLKIPAGGKSPDGVDYTYSANDCSVGDLDGDGQYEILVKWDPSNSHDNSIKGYTGNVYIDAYKLDGTFLWRIDLGRNIRAGAHYTQLMVYDLDGNGKAEVACKTGDGTIDGIGTVIGDAKADYRNNKDPKANQYGQVFTGNEYFTIFNGETGAAVTTIKYEPERGAVTSWGDDYGNRSERYLAAIAYLDGERPSIVMCRGYYTRTVLVAYNFRDGQLTKAWTFDTNISDSSYAGQGNHNLTIADVDFDGKDEIIYGACVIDDNGKGLNNTGIGHGDAIHVSNLDPSTKDIEVFKVNEDNPGAMCYNPRTGQIIWQVKTPTDCGRGIAADIDPNYPGAEMWAQGGVGLRDSKGNLISSTVPAYTDSSNNSINTYNFSIWWDGDLLRELLDGVDAAKDVSPVILKYDPATGRCNTILTADGTYSNNSTKATPNLQADILGDWREEAVWRSKDSSELRIYTTNYITDNRIYTLMHDLQYRESIAWQNVAYNQPPQTSFFLGAGMNPAPIPKMYTVAATKYPAPTDFKVTGTTKDSVSLEWQSVSGAVYYDLFRSESVAGTFGIIARVEGTSYTDNKLQADKTYYYKVSVSNAVANVVPSDAISATTNAVTRPTELKASNITDTTLTLKWTAADDALSYNIYRKTVSDSVYTKIGDSTTTTFNDIGLHSNTSYIYCVSSVTADGESKLSDSLTATTSKVVIETNGGTADGTNANTGNTTGDNSIVKLPNIEVDAKTGIATVKIDENAIKDALAKAQGSEKSAVIQIPDSQNVSDYKVVIPSSVLTTKEVDSNIKIKTNVAEIKLPSNILLDTKSMTAKQIEFELDKIDKSQLADELKQNIGNRPVIELAAKADGEKLKTTNLNTQVTVSMPYTPTEEEKKNPDHIVVLNLSDNGDLVPIPNGKYDESTGKVVFKTTDFGKFTVAYKNKSFEDIKDHSWAKDAIEVMASKGVVNGTSDKTFNPEDKITRADFTLMLVKALGLSAKVDSNFTDVDKTDYYYDAVNIAKALGLAKGDGNNTFNPNESISRQDMMVITARALKISKKLSAQGNTSSLVVFKDKTEVAPYAIEDLGNMVNEGLIKGNDDKINPTSNSTRAEAILLMYRIYNKA